MDISIKHEYVIITFIGGTQYSMTYKVLADIEKAIKIIRFLQETSHIDSCEIKVT